jgi:hypothetical protein
MRIDMILLPVWRQRDVALPRFHASVGVVALAIWQRHCEWHHLSCRPLCAQA